jgi:hypothetical protein
MIGQLLHSTTPEAAASIDADGFRDGKTGSRIPILARREAGLELLDDVDCAQGSQIPA